MKKVLLSFVVSVLISASAFSQGVDGVLIDPNNATTRDASAVFQAQSTSQGVLVPRMTAAQRTAIPVSAARDGLMVYQTDAPAGFYYYNGATLAWVLIANTTANLAGVTAGTGLTGGGSSGTITVNAVGDNGLTTNADDIDLGGNLTQAATTITQDNSETFTIANTGTGNTTINLTGTGDLDVQDNGTSVLFVKDDGNVGVGTNNPLNQLHTTGTVRVANYPGGMIGTDASGILQTRSIAGTTNQLDVTNGNGVAGNPTLNISSSYIADAKANANMTGGGTVSYIGGVLKWTARFIVISNGNGSHFSTNGYFDLDMPTSGTITGVGGAANATATAAGIPLTTWQALYYIMPVSSSNASLAANYRIASYTAAMTVPETWLLVAVVNSDDGSVRLGNGTTINPGGTLIPANPYINNQAVNATFATGQAAGFDITGNGEINGTLNVNGNVGIGTLTASEKLHVNGAIRTETGILNSGTDNVQIMNGVRADDVAYEWTGFYSGATRQGIILYDGPWTGANNITNEFSLTAEGSNLLTLNTSGNSHIGLMPKGTGNVGIGSLSPINKLQVNGDTRIGLVTEDNGSAAGWGNLLYFSGADDYAGWDSDNSDPLYMGRYNTGSNTTDLRLLIGDDDGSAADRFVIGNSTNNLKFAFQMDGNLGVGTVSPAQALEVYKDNADVGIRFHDPGDYHYAMGIDRSDAGKFRINYGAGIGDANHFSMTSGGSIGIGTNTPSEMLHVTGNILSDGIVYWGNGQSRSETRDNAGLQGNAGAKSGFFETSAPSNYYSGASSWQHMIDVRHSNTGNNYAMQLAGSFFDQDMYMRKTNNSASTSWGRVVTSRDIAYVEDRTIRSFGNANVGMVTISNSTNNITVKAGDVISINTSFKFRFTGGSGNDDVYFRLSISGCTSTSQQDAYYHQNWDNDRNELQPISLQWVYVATCAGTLNFTMQMDHNSQADDNADTADMIIVAKRY